MLAKMEQQSPDYDDLAVHLRDPVRFKAQVEAQKTFLVKMMTLAGTKEKNDTYSNEIMSFMTEIAKVRMIV